LVAGGVVEVDFEHDAGDALREGVVVSAFGVGVGRECLLGDVVSEFCDTDNSALSHRCFPPQGLFHIATPLCNRATQSLDSEVGRAVAEAVGQFTVG
jgi:hypothetical protein